VQTGQRATVHVGERAFDAHVDGVVRAGSPVRLEFATRPDVPPRPGMSAIVAVEVGCRRRARRAAENDLTRAARILLSSRP
jgi:hypothetical protein